MVRLLSLIKISFLALLVTACAPAWQMKSSDIEILVRVENWETIQKTWEEFSKKKTRVNAWSKWWTKDGKRYCEIHVPPLNTRDDQVTWRHELRHCEEGNWHAPFHVQFP